MNRRWTYMIGLWVILCCGACSITKNVPDNDALYLGATVEVKDTALTTKERKSIKRQAEELPRPLPNRRFLGIPFKLMFYNMGGDPDKGGFLRKFFRKAGEPPVLLSQLDLDYNVKLLQNYFNNLGYFQAVGTGDTTIKRKKAKAHFTVTPGVRYTIGKVSYDMDSTKSIGKEISRWRRWSLLRAGNPYDLETIKEERSRIDKRLKYRGYFYFSPDYLLLNADSTVGNHQVDMHLVIKGNTPDKALKPYVIDKITIFADYQQVENARSVNRIRTQPYGGYYISDPDNKYKPSLFQQIMVFDSGEVYNLRDHNASLSRLISLDVFKFVKNRFELADSSRSDTGRLNAYYYLTPKQKKSLSLQLTGNSKSNNFVGTEAKFTFRNRNTFRAAEHLDVYANIGSEVQYSGYQKGYNSFKFGGGTKFTFPRFVVPFFTLNTKNSFVPKTIINLEYELLNRRKLYTLNSFKAEWGYNWKPNIFVEEEFKPIAINFVKATNVTATYRDSLEKNPLLNYAVNTQHILGSYYSYTFNQMVFRPKGTGIFFNAIADASGNIAGLIAPKEISGKKKILGTTFSQYIKSQFDFRYYRALGRNIQLANRALVGISYPYGNTKQLPFVKQFFAGGTNSIRAFRSRSIGPGSFRDKRSDNPGFYSDQGGDLRLELNSELRFKVNKILEPAFFVDAGNVWLVNDDVNQPGGRFSKHFLSELAVGTGIGLRLDFSILLFRLDAAIPLRKPWLEPGNRWVIDQINFGDKEWRRKNLILNLAIGYPF